MNLVPETARELFFHEKAQRYRERYNNLRRDLGLSNSSSPSLLVTQEPSRINRVMGDLQSLCNSVTISDFAHNQHDRCEILEVFQARTREVGTNSNQNSVELSWEYNYLIDLSETRYNLVSHLDIKSVVENTPPIAYRHSQLVEQYCYVVELHRFDRTFSKHNLHYLSVIVSYHLKGDYYLPQISCFLSDQQPNINQILLQIQLNQGINLDTVFNKLDVRHHLTNLYSFYKYSCEMRFIDDLILEIMLQKSILVKGKSHKHVSEFVYLLSHYSEIPLSHCINYQIMDPELLDLPSPFIFGSSQPEVLRASNQSVFMINLDNCTFENIPRVAWNLEVKEFISCLGEFLKVVSKGMDRMEIERAVEIMYRGDLVQPYMKEYVRTTGFRVLLEKQL